MKSYLVAFLLLLACNWGVAQTTCTVIKSIPSTPPKTDSVDILISATDYRYSVEPARIYDSFNIGGVGPYQTITTDNPFWINPGNSADGPLNRNGLWGSLGPKVLGFSVCVDAPENTNYYMGFAADNRGTVTIDGQIILRNIAFSYWSIYPITLTKGIHLVEFSIVNDDGPASIGFEIYNNTKQQIIAAKAYADLNLIYSTKDDVGKPAQEGDPATSYSCPVGYTINFCASNGQSPPVCSQFVPVDFTTDFTVNNPPPVCLSAGADITAPQVTAGSVLGLVYSYWKDSLATVPLDNPTNISTSGNYYIMATANGCSAVKPVTVIVNAVYSVANAVICLGDSYLGHTKTGSYTDTLMAKNGCDSIRTINLTAKPTKDTTINAFVCLGGDYLGHTKSGIYRDTLVSANGCDSLVTIKLTVSPDPNFGLLSNICPGDSIILNPGTFSHYRWQDNSTNPTFTAKAPGAYWVTVTDKNGCMTTDTVIINKGHCLSLKIKNTFTPNGDGINDTWEINGLSSYSDCTVFIYSRWGQLVFKSTGYGKPWDGTFNNKALPAGTYYYVIDLKDGDPPTGGYVTLIR